MSGIIELSDATDVSLVGGKAASLGAMIRAGLSVPDGFVIAADAELGEELFAAFRKLAAEGYPKLPKERRVAVRSSAVAEDGLEASWAGQFESYLNVDEARLVESVERCRASGSSHRVREYLEAFPPPPNLPLAKGEGTKNEFPLLNKEGLGEVADVNRRVAVIVQTMVPAEVAGVAFSIDPVTGDRAVVIEAVHGIGDDLVSGRASPDPDALSTMQTEEIVALVHAIEVHFGYPVDVEWAIADEVLYVLQARPITTL